VHEELGGVLLRAAREGSLTQHLIHPSGEWGHHGAFCGSHVAVHTEHSVQTVARETGSCKLRLDVVSEGLAVEQTLGNCVEEACVAQVLKAAKKRLVAAGAFGAVRPARVLWLEL
jgi:hypothetical protein